MIFVVDKSWFFFLFWPTRSPPWICHCMIPTYLCHGGPDGWTTSLLCLGGGWCSVGTFEPQFLPHFSHEHIYVFLSRCCYPHLYYHDHHHYHNCFYDICCCLPSIHPVLYIFCVHLYGNLPGRTIFCLCYDPDLSNNYAQIFRCYSAYKCWICCWILSRSSEGIGGTLLVSVPIVGSGTLCRSYRTSLSGIFIYIFLPYDYFGHIQTSWHTILKNSLDCSITQTLGSRPPLTTVLLHFCASSKPSPPSAIRFSSPFTSGNYTQRRFYVIHLTLSDLLWISPNSGNVTIYTLSTDIVLKKCSKTCTCLWTWLSRSALNGAFGAKAL